MQKKTIKLFLSEAWKFKFRLVPLLINVVITVTIGAFVGPYIISQLLGMIQAGSIESVSAVMPLVIAYAATQLYGEVIGWRLNLYWTWTFETAAMRNIGNRMFKHLTNQSVTFHANRFGGSLVSQANKLNGSFERFWDSIIYQLLPALTSVVAAVIILSFVMWQYALVLLVLSIIFTISVFFGSRHMGKLNVKESQASTKLTGYLADSMANIMAIKSHGEEPFEAREYDKLEKKWQRRSLDNMSAFLKISTGYSMLITTLNTVALVAALWASTQNIIPLSAVYLMVAYTFTVARQLWEMNNVMRNYNRIMGDANDMIEILDLESDVKDVPGAKPLLSSSGSIFFEHVTFAHHENKDPLFMDLNLRIKPGEKIGLVGHSGGGKTTLTKLLLRFMDINDGVITVDGQDISQVQQASLRQHIAYVPQEPLMFHRTIAENIGYGRQDASLREIKAVARMANAHEFIDKLPKGYETLVGERGVKLSGGQRQRVAIARAMIKNAPILVLDEATSALDSESEVLIQEALWKLMEGRTAIVIAHRLSTVQKMDRIIVLNNGKIVEQGSHKELIARKGTYAELWDHQTGGFIEE